ncbi:hypothetical protein [Escherichia albertii]|uniref:hypothetical protein n=1 Tax=Escherichia albertii TaxID=208962 RepID=UPI0023604F28|nr:hypothetical protein [Escherichia albertii]MDD9749388.1 hypothetical protein [Escherichia albertii]WDC20011.1 hypothetical protein PS041_21530 [Escherichia albertii]
MDMPVKADLEDKIKEKYTIGDYEFDEVNKCFWGDAEIELYLYEVDTDIWRSCDVWYFDGYENGLSDHETEDLVFFGDKASVKSKVIEKFNENPQEFMGFKIIYRNIAIVFETRRHLL